MSCRSWWCNCALEADAEILKIDGMEDEIAPLGPSVPRIRELISTLELCHHKAERWVLNIIEAIGRGETNKGLGTRSSGRHHAVERVWQDAYAALSAWCAGRPSGGLDFSVGPVAASGMLAGLGERSPLKEWQVLALLGEPTEVSRWLAASPGQDDPASVEPDGRAASVVCVGRASLDQTVRLRASRGIGRRRPII